MNNRITKLFIRLLVLYIATNILYPHSLFYEKFPIKGNVKYKIEYIYFFVYPEYIDVSPPIGWIMKQTNYYDNNGNLIYEKIYDYNGKLIENTEYSNCNGVKYIKRYDSNEILLDELRIKYDSSSNMVEKYRNGVSENKISFENYTYTNTPLGYKELSVKIYNAETNIIHEVHYCYDDNFNVIELHETSDNNTYHRWSEHTFSNNQETGYTSYLSVSNTNKVTLNYVNYIYNWRGNVIKKYIKYIDGPFKELIMPVSNKYSEYLNYEYDYNDNKINEIKYNSDDKIIGKKIYKYDQQNNLIEMREYRNDDTLIKYFKWQYEYY